MYIANWVRQAIAEPTAGDILLGIDIPGYVGCRETVPDQSTFHYSIEDGLNRETGIGVYSVTTNSVTRTKILEQLVNEVLIKTPSNPMVLSINAVFSITGTVKGLINHAPVWKELVGEISRDPATGYLTPDMKVITGSIKTYMFSPEHVESLSVVFTVPHDIQVGAQLLPVLHWSPHGTDTAGVRWGFEFVVSEAGTGIFKDSATLYFSAQTEGVMDKHYTTESAVTMIAPKPNSIIIGRLFRDSQHPTDTFSADIIAHKVGMFYLSNAVGTPQRNTNMYDWE